MALLVVMSAVSLATAPVQAQTASSGFCYTFTRNLGVGRTLNTQDAQALTTVLTNAGLWTSGTSITTFDDSVASAVSGFQQKYAAQILTPNGLSYGTGYVGAATRAQLNSMYGCSTTTQPVVQSAQCPAGFTCTPINATPVAPVCPPGYTCTPASAQSTPPSSYYTSNPGMAGGRGGNCPVGQQSSLDGLSCVSDNYYQSAPVITSISPTQGSSNTTVTIYGSNLSGVSSVEFYAAGSQFAASVVPSSVTSNSVTFTLGGAFGGMVSSGLYQVGVVGSGAGGINSNRIGFTFNAPTASSPAPVITSISPTQGTSNSTVTIYGSNLSGVSSIEFYTSGGQFAGSIVPSSVSATNVIFTLSGAFAYNVAGTYQVGVVGNGPGGINSNRLNFTVNVPSTSAPVITSISPTQGSSNTTVTIYGSNLSGVSSVEFYAAGSQFAASVVPSSVTSNSVTFTLGGAFGGMVSSGLYQVGVVGSGAGGINSNRIGFTFNAPQ